MTETPTETPEKPRAASKTSWKKARVHEGVTLPSGTVVTITLPNLAALIKAGQIPNGLVEDALAQRKAEAITKEVLLSTWEFTKFIVPATVSEPSINEDDVDDLPIEDVEMLVSFATRNSDVDAVGHQLGGLETQRSFREHRGLLSLHEVVGGLPAE